MKKILLFIASLLFSLLFYKKDLGLNYLLFNIITIVLIVIYNPKTIQNKTLIFKSFLYLLTAIFVFIHHSTTAFFANTLSLFVLLGSIKNHKSSIYIKLINGFYTTIASWFTKYFDYLESTSKTKKTKNINYLYWLKIIIITGFVLLTFIFLYKNVNPVFNKLITKINLNFINISWILCTLLGFYLSFNIANPVFIESITKKDLKISNFLSIIQTEFLHKEILENENSLGIILMSALNILILFLLITDVIYFNTNTVTGSASHLSSQVHSGIYAVIISILLAISIIIYFFKGSLNFYKKNKTLKNITYTWIILNGILVFFTIYKNQLYVTDFGLTYKRIGVYIYLLLSLFGLFFTFIKVAKTKNITYLFRTNISVSFYVLILCAAINWNTLITKYNLQYVKNIDLKYLINLPYDNSKLLSDYEKKHILNTIDSNAIKTKQKRYNYLKSKKVWQEFTLENFKIKL